MDSIDSNCHSLSDNFSIYERYLRSFNVVNNIIEEDNSVTNDRTSAVNENYDGSNNSSNIGLSAVVQLNELDNQCECTAEEINRAVVIDINKPNLESSSVSQTASLLDNSSTTVDNCLTDKSEAVDIPITSEDSKPETVRQPIFITSTMENSNNAVDSVPMFRNVRPSQTVFKLPIKELSFNGTIKHIQKMKPIVDPLTAFSSNKSLVALCHKSIDESNDDCSKTDGTESLHALNDTENRPSSISDDHSSNNNNIKSESTGDSQYEEFTKKKEYVVHSSEEGSSSKWNSEQSYSSLEASFDSGVRSPDLFSDGDDDDDDDDNNKLPQQEPFWNFQKDFEAHDKKRLRNIQNILQGVLPPPSVTILKTDVTQMLKKYYCFLPAFTSDQNVNNLESNSVTPTKKVSFIHIPTDIGTSGEFQKMENDAKNESFSNEKSSNTIAIETTKSEVDLNSSNDKTVELKMCTQTEAINTGWPEVLKCRHYDVYYNNNKYSEQIECLAQRYIERFVGAETDTSVCIHSGGLQSPSSAVKRKALRLAQAKSPGRRLSHLARRRQTFCSAANISEKVQSSTSKMVYIDKNFFPHRKLINGKSPRKLVTKRTTPGKKTPTRKTPGKKTPSKTPKTRSGGSSRKKAMRRLLMDSDSVSKTQPTRETLKRALFVSPEGRKTSQPAPSSSMPVQAFKSRRALFGSPVTADAKSCDGSQSDQFLKRKFDAVDGEHQNNSRSKIPKSFSFGGDTVAGPQSHAFQRRASEVLITKNMTDLHEHHKQKLLWAVSVALRIHGWGMSSPGFREKASTLARLTRKLLTLPPHAARLASPNLSTSDTMLKLARKYVFAIIQGRTVEDCFEEETTKLANEANSRITGYISESAYQQLKAKQAASAVSKIKENTCADSSIRQEQPKSSSKNVLQDKLVNIDANSNSSSGLSMMDRSGLGLFKSNSMPSFEETAKLRARRQISFDNVDFPKR